MKLLVQPDHGTTPLVSAIQKARTNVDLTIFRFDRKDLEQAIEGAVKRGVVVRALIAHTNADGERNLRELEHRLLAAGVSVARSGDDLTRYHHKLMVVDRRTLYVLGFNYTRLDTQKTRSFGIVTKKRSLVQESLKLFDADSTRQSYAPVVDDLIVSPINARGRLAAFIRKARRQLLIYDPKITDRVMIGLLEERARAGVEIRILGKVGKQGASLDAAKLSGLRLHVRAIVRDGYRAFVGSQSLRKVELDKRREVGIIVRDRKIVSQIASTFDADWARTRPGEGEDGERQAG